MPSYISGFIILQRRRMHTAVNSLISMKLWEFFVTLSFSLAGVAILAGLHFWFYRVMKYISTVQIIGPLLPWKLTSMAFLMMFSMVAVSSLIAAMTTLYYSFDLKFLFSSPVSTRTLFLDKTVEAALYSSWTLALVMVPFIFALGRVVGGGVFFYLYFLLMLVPFVLLGAAFGIALSMALMYFFPTSRTRDMVWMLASLALTFVYVMIRFSQPERLVRPDTISLVANYLQYLQAPTAPYLPSWWLVGGMQGFVYGRYGAFAWNVALLLVSVVGLYALMTYLSKWVYMKGFSGAQEGMRRGDRGSSSVPLERRLVARGWVDRMEWTLLWKDRKLFTRDVRYWSQFALIVAIMLVYLFSIRQLPVDSPDMKSLISFLNLCVAGFVVASVGLRFTFPAISLEGKAFWVVRMAPMGVERIMLEKVLLLAVPSVLIGVLLVGCSNYLLQADYFISVLSVGTIIVCSMACCIMGIGMGAVFPKFNVENIHQIESSAGGFIYMAMCMGYIALTMAIESYFVRVHFSTKFWGTRWDPTLILLAVTALVALNLAAMIIPWRMGVSNLKRYEL